MEPDGSEHGLPVVGQPSAPAADHPPEVGQPAERLVRHGLPDQRPERLDRLEFGRAWGQEVQPDVRRDGQQFLIATQLKQAATEPMSIILNWAAKLNK